MLAKMYLPTHVPRYLLHTFLAPSCLQLAEFHTRYLDTVCTLLINCKRRRALRRDMHTRRRRGASSFEPRRDFFFASFRSARNIERAPPPQICTARKPGILSHPPVFGSVQIVFFLGGDGRFGSLLWALGFTTEDSWRLKIGMYQPMRGR